MRICTSSPMLRASKVRFLRIFLRLLAVVLFVVAIAEIGPASASPSRLLTSMPDAASETARFAYPAGETSADFSVLAAPATFTVNTVDDVDDGTCDGVHCSLREAIKASNANVGFTDTIEFDIPGAGPHTIQPDSALPIIPLIATMSTQPCSTCWA